MPFRHAVLLPLLLAGALPSQPARRGLDSLTILHTNDLHAHVSPAPGGIAGFAAVAGYFNSVRRGRSDVLVVDAGDCISGTPLSSLTRGTAVFDLLSLMGYHAATLGNHEYDHGWEMIPEFVKRARHPIVCANAFDPEGRLLAGTPTLLLDVDGVKVGIIGLVTEETPRQTVRKGNVGIRFDRAVDAARRLVPEVDREADLVLLLTHLGLEQDRKLAGAVPGIDLIVGGHSHTELPEPVRVGDTWIAQAWEYTKRVGRIDIRIDLDTERLVEVMGRLVAPAELAVEPDPEVARRVAELDATVARTVDVRLAAARQDLDKEDLRRLVEMALRESCRADFGFQNSGGVRGEIQEGPITLRDLWRVLPFENNVMKLRLKGSEIGGEFARSRRRLDPDRTYTIVTNSFVTEHLRRFFGVSQAPVEDTGRTIREAVADYLKERGTVP